MGKFLRATLMQGAKALTAVLLQDLICSQMCDGLMSVITSIIALITGFTHGVNTLLLKISAEIKSKPPTCLTIPSCTVAYS